MQRFHWTAQHAVFEAEFDAEHRELFRLSEELRKAVEAGADAQATGEAVRLVVAGVEAHFAHEERQMRSGGYSAYPWHKRQHDGARQRLQELSADPKAMLVYLTGWIRDHIGVADRMMAASLRNAGRLRVAKAS